MANPKVSAIVLNWNGKEDTCRCLHSLLECTYSNLEIVIVDNGSSDDSVATFKQEFPSCCLIETGKNLGYAGGNNVGIQSALASGADYILLLNNDTIVDKTFIEAFLAGFSEDLIGILGAKIYLMDEPNRLDHFGGNWNSKKRDFDFVGYKEQDDGKTWERPLALDYVCGASLMIRKEVFEKVGLLDERFFLFYEETDFCAQARRAGFKTQTCPKARIWHKVSASFSGGKPHTTYFTARNRLLWIEKNLSGLEKMQLLRPLAAAKYLKLTTLLGMRKGQRLLQKLLRRGTGRNDERILRARAELYGIQDYFARNFGAGRSHHFF